MMWQIQSYFKVKEDKVYPWPWPGDQSRTARIFTSDVLTKRSDGTFMRHTGVGIVGLHIPEQDLIKVNDPVTLKI